MVDYTKLSDHTFEVGDIYAVTTGRYLGEFFVYMESCPTSRKFLSLPEMVNREIENKHIDHALSKNIIEFQQKLPAYVRKMCVKQYKQNEKNIH